MSAYLTGDSPLTDPVEVPGSDAWDHQITIIRIPMPGTGMHPVADANKEEVNFLRLLPGKSGVSYKNGFVYSHHNVCIGAIPGVAGKPEMPECARVNVNVKLWHGHLVEIEKLKKSLKLKGAPVPK